MKDYKSIWKTLANNKQNNKHYHIQYCILKAMTAKTNTDKIILAAILLEKAFSPISNLKKLVNGRKKWDMLHHKLPDWIGEHLIILGIRAKDFFENDEELKQFIEIWNATAKENNLIDRKYVYFFVDKTIPIVQYIVQTAHVAYVAGHQLSTVDPYHTHFVIFETEDIKNDVTFLFKNNIKFRTFNEPDLGNKITAIVTEPLEIKKKLLFQDFKLLTI